MWPKILQRAPRSGRQANSISTFLAGVRTTIGQRARGQSLDSKVVVKPPYEENLIGQVLAKPLVAAPGPIPSRTSVGWSSFVAHTPRTGLTGRCENIVS